MEHLVEELSVVAVEEVRDVIVVFAVEKLLNFHSGKNLQILHNKKREIMLGNGLETWACPEQGKIFPILCLWGEISLSRISGALRGVRVVKSLE